MLVSTFELIFAPITPTPGAVARRILQGYFLTITNLESTDYQYQLQFTITTPTPPDVTRLLTNGVLLVDNGIQTSTALPGTTNNIIGLNAGSGASAAVYTSGLFAIRARQTALAVLLPGNPGSPTFFSDPAIRAEVRGYVTLRLPALLTFMPGDFGFGSLKFVAQSANPVNVLVNPETRGAFVPAAGGSATGFDFDNVESTMVVASGKAQNTVNPEPGYPLVLNPVAVDFGRFAALADLGVAQADDNVRTATLLALLSQIDTGAANMKTLEAMLKNAGIPITMQARK